MMHMNKNYSPFYTTPWPKKKVVSIPVHFVESNITINNNNNRNNSAIQIQKVWRGFLVRKNMRKIKGISVELEKIEEKLCDIETKDLIIRDQKESLKVSESIMNLLLKLDSVRVFDYYSVVKDYRKSVIKKAIALQELVDQIHMVGSTYQNNSDEVEPNTRDSYLIKREIENEKEVGVEENESRLVGSEEDCKEMLERMMEENERMMEMMRQLFERNEMQTKLLSSLSQRVEQLERAYTCDKLKRKNKGRNAHTKHK